MDRKSIIIIAVSILVMMGWSQLVSHLYPPKPISTNSLARALAPKPTNALAQVAATATATATEFRTSPRALVTPNAPEQSLFLENNVARYSFTSHGGGLKLVELKDYPGHVNCDATAAKATNNFASLNAGAHAPVLALLGAEAVQGDQVFTLTKTANGVQAEKILTNGLRLVKEFQVGSNFVIRAKVRLENPTAQPLAVPDHELVVGTATPIGTNDPPNSLGLFSYDGNAAEHIMGAWFVNAGFACMALVSRPV